MYLAVFLFVSFVFTLPLHHRHYIIATLSIPLFMVLFHYISFSFIISYRLIILLVQISIALFLSI